MPSRPCRTRAGCSPSVVLQRTGPRLVLWAYISSYYRGLFGFFNFVVLPLPSQVVSFAPSIMGFNGCGRQCCKRCCRPCSSPCCRSCYRSSTTPCSIPYPSPCCSSRHSTYSKGLQPKDAQTPARSGAGSATRASQAVLHDSAPIPEGGYGCDCEKEGSCCDCEP